MLKLYHFPHCPYCVRVRLALGYLQIPWESKVVRYDDVDTRVKLSGGTKAPFVILDDGQVIKESLDIIKRLDRDDTLQFKNFESSGDAQKIEALLNDLSRTVHPLTWPYWVYTPEFDLTMREYAMKTKSKTPGGFAAYFHNQEKYLQELAPLLKQIENMTELTTPVLVGAGSPRPELYNHIMIRDVLIAAHLWGLYLVPEFQFSPKLHAYLQNIKKLCRFKYHGDFWKE